MLEAFYLAKHQKLLESRWQEKLGLSSEILSQAPLRAMRPETVGDRARLDLMLWGTELGIRGRSQNENPCAFEFFPIREPDSPRPELSLMLKALWERPPPLGMAQLRLRHSSVSKELGLWIDCSHELQKQLLNEETEWLNWAIAEMNWVVEVGQLNKEIYWDKTQERYKFRPSQARPWLSSFCSENNEYPLLSTVSSFSQPGHEVNRALIAAGLELVQDYSGLEAPFSWAEWGAGYGNLSLPMAKLSQDKSPWVSEGDPHLTVLLKNNFKSFLPELPAPLSARAEAERGPNKTCDLWLLDPPRSGFAPLLERLGQSPELSPRKLLCYHCHQKGLLGDQRVLKSKGYRLIAWSSVDAFPGTVHHEVISLWEKA